MTFEKILDFLESKLAAHEGGAGTIKIYYDDATFNYVITQTHNHPLRDEILGCSRSLSQAINFAITGDPFGEKR